MPANGSNRAQRGRGRIRTETRKVLDRLRGPRRVRGISRRLSSRRPIPSANPNVPWLIRANASSEETSHRGGRWACAGSRNRTWFERALFRFRPKLDVPHLREASPAVSSYQSLKAFLKCFKRPPPPACRQHDPEQSPRPSYVAGYSREPTRARCWAFLSASAMREPDWFCRPLLSAVDARSQVCVLGKTPHFISILGGLSGSPLADPGVRGPRAGLGPMQASATPPKPRRRSPP